MKVDFFIVGAPKCGTSAMADYLNQHPDIFIPEIKEPSFFGSDLTRYIQEYPLYEELFTEGVGKICCDATTWYLYSRSAAAEIFQHNPNSKIIIMLRNPVDVMYSLHSQNLYNGDVEDIKDFNEALVAEDYRRRGERIPKGCGRIEALFYRDTVRFTDQVTRYIEQFGSDNVKVIIYDDFKREPAKVYEDVLNFIGVSPYFKPEQKEVNANKRLRSKLLHDTLRHPPDVIKIVSRLVPKRLRRAVGDRLSSLNSVVEPRPPMNQSLRAALTVEFQHEIARLEDLLDKDLSEWVG